MARDPNRLFPPEAAMLDILFGVFAGLTIDLSTAAGKNEKIQLLLGHLLKPFKETPALWTGFKSILNVATPAVTGALRRKIESSDKVPPELREPLSDALDDVIETLVRENVTTVDQATIDRLVNAAAAPTPNSNPSPASPTAATGAPMTTTPTPAPAHPPGHEFRLAEETYILGRELADQIALLNPVGFRRWARLSDQLHRSEWTDPTDEIPGSQIIVEALQCLFAVNPEAARAILQNPDGEKVDVREDPAVRALFGTAKLYLTGPERQARFAAAVDAFLNGKTTKTVTRVVAGVGIGTAIGLACLLFGAVGGIFIGLLVLIIGALNGSVLSVGIGLGLMILGAIAFMVFMALVSKLEEPFTLLKNTINKFFNAINTRIAGTTPAEEHANV